MAERPMGAADRRQRDARWIDRRHPYGFLSASSSSRDQAPKSRTTVRTLRRHVLIFVLAICVLACASACFEMGPVPTSEVLQYSAFAGLTASEVWLLLDGADYWAVPLTAPAGYYDTVDTTSPLSLRTTLHELIDDHVVYRYSTTETPPAAGFRVDTWDIIALADAHPEEADSTLDLYLNGTFARQLKGVMTSPRYDREHSWPKSLGFDNEGAPAYTDCHHLFAAYSSYNSSRGNKPYGKCGSGTCKPTETNLGQGGSGVCNTSCPQVWETWSGRRGDVARAMFYMAIRYEGDAPREPDLELTDTLSLITTSSAWQTQAVAYMGLLSVLVEWHAEDPVDDSERRRNSSVYLFQGNRNPFIDHPEWVAAVFGS
jgi:endonuclease I